MKEYMMYLFVDDDKLKEWTSNINNDFNLFKNYSFIVTDKTGKYFFDNTDKEGFDINSTRCFLFLVEVFDKVDENNFGEYFSRENANFRLTDLQNDMIIRYSNEDFDIVYDLINKYGHKLVCLYNRDYSQEELKLNINKLKLVRNTFVLLNIGFIFGITISIEQLLSGYGIISAVAAMINYMGITGTFDNFKKNSASVEINKRLLKRKEEKKKRKIN